MKLKRLPFIVWMGVVCVATCLSSQSAWGQGGGFPVVPDTGNQNFQQFPQQGQQPVQNQQGQGQQGQGGGQQTAQTTDSSGPLNIDPSQAVEFSPIEDNRNQGFVGITATKVTDLGFVGTPSETSGPPPAEGTSFGGGVNNSQPGSAAGGSAFGGGQRGGGFGNLGANQFGAGTQNFFEVQRGGLRGAIKPSFTTPQFSNDQLVERFNVSFSRLPESQSFNGQYQVTVNDKRATVTGWVSTQADADRLIAQLRFQPGVYSIDNQLEIRQK